jgi:hypothetical protein
MKDEMENLKDDLEFNESFINVEEKEKETQEFTKRLLRWLKNG